MDLININEFDGPKRLVFPTKFLHLNVNYVLDLLNENHRKIREQLPKGPNFSMRSEAKRLRSLLNLVSENTWSPQELASAGFFSTGVEDSCQCFCCGLVLCNQSVRTIPIEIHKQFNPDCAFIQGIDVGNISKYDIRPQSIAISPSDHRMQDEQARLQTFSCWPPYTLMEPDVLAQAGFFSTGTRDHVQCFSCGGCLGNWEENDDPWKEHAKWIPECQFLQGQKSKDEIQQYTDNYDGFRGITGSFIFRNIQNSELQFSTAEIRNMEVKLSSVMEYRGHYPAELQNMTVNGSSLPNMEFGYNYDDNYPEHLIRGIHNFPYLSEVTIELQKNHKVMDDLPIEFERLFRMKKLALGCTGLGTGSSKLVPIIKQFTDLEVLHLSLHRHEDFSGLMNSLSECKKLEELSFFGSYLLQDDMAVLASTMKNFKSLKILDLMCQVIMLKEVSETFAMALGSLCLLEKLLLPAGDGMAHSVKLVIKQLQNVPNLKFLNIVEILDDESIALLAEEAKYGNLKKLQRLEMLNNSKVTESGWETFFEEAKHMPELNYLNIDLGNSEIKCRPTTVTSFVRFVSRLPSLVRIIMFGWLLDKDDLDMFNAMKEKHPQSKSLWIQSIKMLPFPPTIED